MRTPQVSKSYHTGPAGAAGGNARGRSLLDFRLAELADSPALLAWRNDPHARSMMISTDLVDPQTHDAWFRNSLANRDRIMVIAQTPQTSGASQAVAIVRFDRVGDEMHVSINMNPAMRGQGFAAPALLGAERYLPRDRPLILLAEIKSGNAASRKAFVRAGYRTSEKPNGSHSGTIHYRKSTS